MTARTLTVPASSQEDRVRRVGRLTVLGTVVLGALALFLLTTAVLTGDITTIVVAAVLGPLAILFCYFWGHDDRRSLRARDVAVHALTTCAAPGEAPPAVDVELRPDGRGGQQVRWGGAVIATRHRDGTVTGSRREVPAVEKQATGSSDVEVVTLGPATFVRWRLLWTDEHGRSWRLPVSSEIGRDVVSFPWPSATAPEGLLAYLDAARP